MEILHFSFFHSRKKIVIKNLHRKKDNNSGFDCFHSVCSVRYAILFQHMADPFRSEKLKRSYTKVDTRRLHCFLKNPIRILKLPLSGFFRRELLLIDNFPSFSLQKLSFNGNMQLKEKSNQDSRVSGRFNTCR